MRTHGLLENSKSTIIRPDSIHSGANLILLIQTCIGTHKGLSRLFPEDFTPKISTGIVVLQIILEV